MWKLLTVWHDTWSLKPDTWSLATCSPAPDTRGMAHGIWHLTPGFWHLTPVTCTPKTWLLAPETGNLCTWHLWFEPTAKEWTSTNSNNFCSSSSSLSKEQSSWLLMFITRPVLIWSKYKLRHEGQSHKHLCETTSTDLGLQTKRCIELQMTSCFAVLSSCVLLMSLETSGV